MNLYSKLLQIKNPRILILRMSSFGDIVKTIPVYFYIKKVLPDSTIYWIVKNKYTKLLQTFGISYIEGSKKFSIFNFQSSIFNYNFDIIFDFQANLKSGFLSSFIPSKYKIGFTQRYTKELNFLFRNNFLSDHSKTIKSIPLNKLIVNTYNKPYALLYKLGFPHYASLRIEPKISPEIKNKIEDWISNKNISKFVLIHPGSSKKGKNKRWAIENFIRLVKDIKREFNIPSIILSGQDEKELESLFKNISTVPDFEAGLEEMIMLIKKCTLFIGNDSGPLHLASILDVKTLGIYPASNPFIMAHPQSHYVSNYFYLNDKQNKNLSIAIPYEQVWRKVKLLL